MCVLLAFALVYETTRNAQVSVSRPSYERQIGFSIALVYAYCLVRMHSGVLTRDSGAGRIAHVTPPRRGRWNRALPQGPRANRCSNTSRDFLSI
jgi:hypothetical protein